MKRVLFVTKSKLSQNLLEIIIKSIPKKLEYHVVSNLDDLQIAFFPKPIQLVIIDSNVLSENGFQEAEWDLFKTSKLKASKKILIHARDTKFDLDKLKSVGVLQSLSKPFLPEELVEIINKQLGSKK